MIHEYVAIIGSRNYPDFDAVHRYVQRFGPETVVVSGQARGVDSVARQAALEHGLNVVDVPAIWKHHGRGAGFRRNRIIIEITDRVVAFWDLESRGTVHGIRLALEERTPVVVYGPDGVELDEAYIRDQVI